MFFLVTGSILLEKSVDHTSFLVWGGRGFAVVSGLFFAGRVGSEVNKMFGRIIRCSEKEVVCQWRNESHGRDASSSRLAGCSPAIACLHLILFSFFFFNHLSFKNERASLEAKAR